MAGGTELLSTLNANPRELRAGLSVVLITKNEQAKIERCLRSVGFADEIVVLDGASQDATVRLARDLGARVEVDPDWPGFGAQKNRVLAMASHAWVLSLDADEVVTPELAQSVSEVVRGDQTAAANGYWINRRSCLGSRVVRFGDWQSDRVLRLCRNGAGRFSNLPVHEQLECAPPLARLDGYLMHYTWDSVSDALAKVRRYAQAGAPSLASRGRGGLPAAMTHAVWTLLRGLIFRLGFLDGWSGLCVAGVNAYGTWCRYRLAGRLRDQHGV